MACRPQKHPQHPQSVPSPSGRELYRGVLRFRAWLAGRRNICNIPQSVPSPSGRELYRDAFGFSAWLAGRRNIRNIPNRFLLPQGGSFIEVFSGSVHGFQAAEHLQHPPIGSFSLRERARVRELYGCRFGKKGGRYKPKYASNTRCPSSAMRGVMLSCNWIERAYTRSPNSIASANTSTSCGSAGNSK